MSGDDKKVLSFIERGARILVWVGGGGLIAMAFVVTGETLIRKFANSSLGGVFEISAYCFAVSSSWAFGWALIEGTHIRIELLRESLGRRGRVVLDVLAWFAFLIVFGAIAFRAFELVVESYLTGARAPTPDRTLLFVPQLLWAFGFLVTVICALALGYRVVRERSTRSIALRGAAERELEHLR